MRVRQSKVEPNVRRIPIRPRTAELLLKQNDNVAQVQRALDAETGKLNLLICTLYTEHGIAEGKLLEVTEGDTPEMVVEVVKAEEE